MNSSDSFDRDELIAAYLDGEATPAERAEIEADPELLERAELLRQVADMVAEPVAPPPPHVRAAHIAAALEASATTPVVTSLQAARAQRRVDFTKVLGAAAVGLLMLFAGVAVFTSGGGDDDSASTTTEADAATEDADAGQDEGSEELAGTAMLEEDTSAQAPAAEADTAESADMDDTGDDMAEAADEAPPEEAESEPAADDAADSGNERLLDRFLFDSAVIVVPTTDGFLAEVTSLLGADESDDASDGEEAAPGPLGAMCINELLQFAGDDPIVAAGFATVADQEFEFVVVETVEGPVAITVDATTCTLADRLILNQ